MIILACSNIFISFGTDRILDNIGFNLQQGEKAGLVGVNGAGKSTLFKIINGILQPDSGEIYIAKGLKMGYLDQNSGLVSGNTIWDELLSAYSGLLNMEGRLKLLEKRISQEAGNEIPDSLMMEYDALMEKFSREGGYEYNSRVRGVLRGLGFRDDQFGQKVQSLSGGQKTRLALAKLLLEEPDVLMLDEPTNHLDVEALEWLENYLKDYRKCLFVISHDRYFLDVVTSRTIELENRECRAYDGNYSAYARQKTADRIIQQKHFDRQQKEISRMEAFIEQQKRWNREKNIIAAESRQKAIDRMEKPEAPKKLPDKIRINFRSNITSGNDVLKVENLSMEYPGKPLFEDISFELKRNERVFLMGPNGCGKTTLLRTLSGRITQTRGNLEYGHKIILGYYDQELEDLDENRTILEEVWDIDDKLTHTAIRNALALFLFTGEDVFKTIRTLSGGEKSRVALLKLVLSGANFLILDEPTNHLDIESREVLEEALQNFDGTMLAVSHDRYFINKLATRVFEMSGRRITDYKGNYAYYVERRKSRANEDASSNPAAGLSASRLEHMESKEEKAFRRKLEKHLNETEKSIDEIEGRLFKIGKEMTAESSQSDHILLSALLAEQEDLKSRLDGLIETWTMLTEQKESAGNV